MAGFAYAFALYYRERKNEFGLAVKWSMAILRGIAVTVIAFLLLNPMLKTLSKHAEKPIIIFAQDNSHSIVSGADSAFYQTEYIEELKAFLSGLNSKYDLREYAFGDKFSELASYDFSEKQTDISELFSEIKNRFSNRNVGAMILATDGIFNSGLNPLYAAEDIPYPVYTIALGDTNVRKDVVLNKVNFNRIAYQGNEFPVEVILSGSKCGGLSTKVTISKDSKTLFSKTITFPDDDYFETIQVHLKAEKKGLQRYQVSLSHVKGEVSVSNNSQYIFVEVLEGKQKILILANSPHPDISALKQSILENKNYEVDDFMVNKFDKNPTAYNLVILHQLPSVQNPLSTVYKNIEENNIPVLFVVGKQTNMAGLNNLNLGLSIKGQILYNESLPLLNNEFALFAVSENVSKALQYSPPLISPFGTYNVSPSMNTLMYQKIGSVATVDPLILFGNTMNAKIGIINGEGIWRWRLREFEKEGSHKVFDEIINKTVQYLSVKTDKSFFRVFSKNDFKENENIEFDAEVYNESYELINSQDVTMTVTNSEAKRFAFTFNKTTKAYYLNAGSLPVDNYRYSAKVNMGDKILTDNGIFTVSELNIEKTNTVANHNLLFNLSEKKDGEMFYPGQLKNLQEKIELREDIKTVTYSQKRYTEILNLPWLLILILALLSTEWFMRKRAGGY
ncbi:MAG: hypothetical protein DRJ05_06375 [Bacteroidetes bacterium]|nr:MAG: hypothetical protein DRJ05_06375 [Bacteroidota bacterium]